MEDKGLGFLPEPAIVDASSAITDAVPSAARDFADQWWDFNTALNAFEEALLDAGADWEGQLGTDWYDLSLEIRKCPNDLRLTEAAQRVIWNAGFRKAYVNHADGWETHYDWSREFTVARGWRRKHKPDGTGFWISFWPTGWTGGRCEDWLASGYVEIAPDPLEPNYSQAPQATASPSGENVKVPGMNTKGNNP